METFKRLTCETDTIDYSNADLRGCDFRNVDLAKIVILGAYLNPHSPDEFSISGM